MSSHLSVWLCAFAGPAAWTAHQLLSLALVPVACFGTGPWLLHTVTALTALLALAGMLVGTSELGRGGTSGRLFVAGASIVSDAFFTLVILAEALPDFLLSPCWS